MKNKSVYNQMTKSEREVAGYLKNLAIQWSYERPVFIWDENKRPRVCNPDFCLIPFEYMRKFVGQKKIQF